MSSDGEILSIGQVSERTGLSVHTLRFYEKEGLFVEPVERLGGRRVYSTTELGWLGICTRLRAAGMPLAEIRRYAELVREGTGNEAERMVLLERQQARIREQMAELQACQDVIDWKVGLYAAHLEAGSAEGVFVEAPECPPGVPDALRAVTVGV